MGKQEKLTKIIEIAVERGYDNLGMYEVQKYGQKIKRTNPGGESSLMDKQRILFSHDFARAYWGEEEIKIWGNEMAEMNNCLDSLSDGDFIVYSRPIWQYHLQQAVVSDDPIQYYWRNKP